MSINTENKYGGKRIRGEDKIPRKKRASPSEETRKKISDSLKGYEYKQEWKDLQSSRMVGRTMSEEQKFKISRTMWLKHHKDDKEEDEDECYESL